MSRSAHHLPAARPSYGALDRRVPFGVVTAQARVPVLYGMPCHHSHDIERLALTFRAVAPSRQGGLIAAWAACASGAPSLAFRR